MSNKCWTCGKEIDGGVIHPNGWYKECVICFKKFLEDSKEEDDE